jgi:hypothetical protein
MAYRISFSDRDTPGGSGRRIPQPPAIVLDTVELDSALIATLEFPVKHSLERNGQCYRVCGASGREKCSTTAYLTYLFRDHL